VKGKNLGNKPQLYNGSKLKRDATLDLSEFSDAFCDLQVKSNFWGCLPDNGVIQGLNTNTITFKAGDEDCTQVFHVKASELLPQYGIHVKFHSNLAEKTILINVAADDNGKAHVANLADFFDTSGNGGFSFSSDLVSRILWNFYDATEVVLGCGVQGNGEFRGSILVPTPSSSLKFCFPGHSGRVIVNGNIEMNKGGSEFHNYDFDPPCALPVPPSYDSCSNIDDFNSISSEDSLDEPSEESPEEPSEESPDDSIDVISEDNEERSEPELSFVCNRPSSCTSVSCAIQCPLDMPAGYYPDLQDCKSYCKCTGTTAPSRYETCQHGLYYDPLGWSEGRHSKSFQWMSGKWGPGTYWGSNGGICNWKRNVKDDRPKQCGN